MQRWSATETLREELVLSVTESDLDSEAVKDAVLDCEGDGLPDALPLDDGLPETCEERIGMHIGAKKACLGLALGRPESPG